jgi:hypothetical protein
VNRLPVVLSRRAVGAQNFEVVIKGL